MDERAPGVHEHAEIRSDVRLRGAAITEGKNDKLIYRNESRDRRGNRSRHVDRRCHGPRVATSLLIHPSYFLLPQYTAA
jgi:hypothetical protein